MAKSQNGRVHLTKESFLSSNLREKEVYIKAFGGWVWIREMSAAQVQNDARQIMTKSGDVDYSKASLVRMISACKQIIDGPGGGRMFDDSEVQELIQKSGEAVAEIVSAVRQFSGQDSAGDNESVSTWIQANYPQIWKEYQKQSKVEQLAENFPQTVNDSLPSA